MYSQSRYLNNPRPTVIFLFPLCFILTTNQIGGQTSSYAQQIADIQRLMQQSGLKFAMHSTGTTIGEYPFILDRPPAKLY